MTSEAVSAQDASTGVETFEGTWEKKGRSPVSAALAGLLGIGVIYFYGQAIIMTVILLVFAPSGTAAAGSEGFFQHMAREAEQTNNPMRVCLIVTQFGLILLPTWVLVRRWHTRRVRAYIRLQRATLWRVFLAASAVLFLFPANIAISQFFIAKLNIPDELVKVSQSMLTASSGGELALVLFALALTPAVCEEILFRGFAQRTLERTMGWKSILVVGLLFGLYHMQPFGLLVLSGLGFLLGYFFFAGKSLLPAMAAHFTNNFLAVCWSSRQAFSPAGASGGPADLRPEWVLMALPFAAVAIVLFHIESRRRAKVLDPVLKSEV